MYIHLFGSRDTPRHRRNWAGARRGSHPAVAKRFAAIHSMFCTWSRIVCTWPADSLLFTTCSAPGRQI